MAAVVPSPGHADIPKPHGGSAQMTSLEYNFDHADAIQGAWFPTSANLPPTPTPPRSPYRTMTANIALTYLLTDSQQFVGEG